MSVVRAPDPDLRALTAALVRESVAFVVIGGFAVIANDYVRATEDVDLLIPDSVENDDAIQKTLAGIDGAWPDGRPLESGVLRGRDHSRVHTSRGVVDLLREGAAPLDFATVADDALRADLGEGEFLVAGLRSLVAFKRLANRPRDRLDLLELEERHGPLPIVHIPGLDGPS